MTPRRRAREEGQATLLIIGFAVVLVMMLAVAVDASAAYLRRQGLDNLADGAALAAADGVQGQQVYLGGLGERARIDPDAARGRVAEYLWAVDAAGRYPGSGLLRGRAGRPGDGGGGRPARPADRPSRMGAPTGDLRPGGVLRRGE